MKNAEFWISHLELQKHPEGGYFREIYRSDETIGKNNLPVRYQGERSFSTSIYFLLKAGEFSAFHKILSDEIWHFYQGDPVELFLISKSGNLQTLRLGNDPSEGEVFQLVIPNGTWFAARVSGKNYSLVGCTVAPGFDFTDFELAGKETLIQKFPRHQDIIDSLTR
jgi:predicted cupin superfamily sugar epimerase